MIVNIDYPLGLAAYNILREVAVDSAALRGVYVLGKAATLNADVGDVMLSSVVHDEHSGSTYWLDNAFGVDDLAGDLRFGTGLDNQRAVTVKSTFLQNRAYLDFYYREAFTVVEMEAGPYCNAIYEIADADRHPVGEAVNFSKLPLDFGIIHYALDTPYTQARTLGARGLSYYGMDSTYASSLAILRRILRLEGALARATGGMDELDIGRTLILWFWALGLAGHRDRDRGRLRWAVADAHRSTKPAPGQSSASSSWPRSRSYHVYAFTIGRCSLLHLPFVSGVEWTLGAETSHPVAILLRPWLWSGTTSGSCSTAAYTVARFRHGQRLVVRRALGLWSAFRATTS